jgi:hypothetical protein
MLSYVMNYLHGYGPVTSTQIDLCEECVVSQACQYIIGITHRFHGKHRHHIQQPDVDAEPVGTVIILDHDNECSNRRTGGYARFDCLDLLMHVLPIDVQNRTWSTRSCALPSE